MSNTTYASRMRYLDAADVDSAIVDFAGLHVQGSDGQKIGEVDGFVIDPEARRARYVVVDSGGWFTSRRLLLPIGHAALGADRRSLQTDVTRDALRRLPEFDDDRFRAFTDEELRAFERNTVVACCPDEPLEEVSDASWGYDTRRHYREPDWWEQTRYAPERARPIERREPEGQARTEATAPGAAVRDAHNRDRVAARAESGVRGEAPDRTDDVSPHFEGRAQPGDVLGIETGGERTVVGDTAEDEDRRRQDAERRERES